MLSHGQACVAPRVVLYTVQRLQKKVFFAALLSALKASQHTKWIQTCSAALVRRYKERSRLYVSMKATMYVYQCFFLSSNLLAQHLPQLES